MRMEEAGMEKLKWIFWYWGGKFRRQFFMSIPESEKDYRNSRRMFIAADTMNQIIGNLAGGTYLMALLAHLGVSDGAIGVILSLGTLAAVFQLFIIEFVQKLKKYKLYVVLTIFQRIWLGVLFLVPFLNCSTAVKAVLVIVMFLFAQIWSQTGNTVSVAWMAMLVPAQIRGTFLARKEAVAVFLAVFSTFVMGIVYDFFTGINMEYAFCVNGSLLIVLALVNTVLFILMKDPRSSLTNAEGKELHGKLAKRVQKEQQVEKKPFLDIFKEAFGSSGFRKVLLMAILWNACYYIVCPFMASYYINDLGLSFTFVTLINLIATVLRVLILPLMGRLSDQKGAEGVLSASLAIFMVSDVIFAFTVPSNGIVMYCIASLVSAVGWSYIGAGLLNIQLKNMEESKQTEQYAILSGISGFSAMAISVVSGEVLDYLQKHRVVFAGRELYAQQILNLVGAALVLILILYIMLVVRKKKDAASF